MRHALVAPVTRSIVIAGILLAVGVIHARTTMHRHRCHHHRLSLHTTARPHSIYFSAWGDGDGHNGVVNITRTSLHPITFKTRVSVSDGCRWLGTETLVPIDEHVYSYSYAETILDCDPDATPALKTPRTGYVTVDD
jgi:hypothetical protein